GASASSLEIRPELGANLPPVNADANQLLQVFVHILNNAGEAILEQGKTGTITLTTSLEQDTIVWSCADTGSGVENPSQVFHPFAMTKDFGKGISLGLSASYGIIQEHGGNIACENRPGGGTIFRITLPVANHTVSKQSSS